MNEQLRASDEFSPLLDAACDGTLNDAQLDELAAALELDAEACKAYIDHISLQADIRFLGRAERLCQIGLDGVQAKLSPAAPPTASTSGLSFLSSPLYGTIGFFSHEVPFSLLIATVITGMGLLMGSFVYVSHHEQIVKNTLPPSPSTQAIPKPQSEYVGRITGMVDVKWSDATTAAVTELVALGRKYALASGLMEITYDTGAKVILQGPCTYQADSRTGGFLSIGKLTARLDNAKPQAADSKSSLSTIHYPLFTIKTPTAVVTDLGTEFGVEVSPTGDTETHVLVGSVRFAKLNKAGGDTEEQVLRAGRAARCDSRQGRISVVKTDARRFTRFMPTSPEGYAAMVLAMRPVAYYRMEPSAEVKDRHVVFDSADGHHGVLHTVDSSSEPWQAGRFAGALHFDGKTYVDIPTLPSAETGELSVTAWVFVQDQAAWANIASEQYARAWTDKVRRMQFGFGLFADSGDLWAGVSDRNGLWCPVREGASRPLSIGYWNHVAFVANGKNLQLYRGGRKVASTPCDGICLTPPIKHLMIGCKNWSNSPDAPALKPVQFWRGRIDELAIFNHALSAADIRRLFYCSSVAPQGEESKNTSQTGYN